jgi:alpha-mannosidase
MKSARYLLAVAAGWLLGGAVASPALAAEGKPEEVIIVCKTHFDIGYTDLARNVVQRYRTSMIDNALRIVDQSRQLPPEQRFIWTLSGWPMQQVLWSGQEPERRKRVAEAIREGRLVWHALPASLHTESLDLEDMVRGMDFSSALSRQFDMPLPRDAKMTDVPSHTWVLPTILKRSGVDFLHIGCNAGSGSPDLPALFWWEGPDGSRLLTMYSPNYGTGLHPPADWPHKTWLALIHTGDNHGPPTPDEIKRLLEQAHRELPGVKIRMGRLSDFGDAILREKPSLPVVRADLSDTWIHGVMSMPIETRLARNLRPAIAAYDTLNTLLSAWGVDTPPCREAVAAAYEGSLMYGEHTWGYDAKQFPRLYGKAWQEAEAAGRYKRLEESWGEKAAYVTKPAGQILPAMATIRCPGLALGWSR